MLSRNYGSFEGVSIPERLFVESLLIFFNNDFGNTMESSIQPPWNQWRSHLLNLHLRRLSGGIGGQCLAEYCPTSFKSNLRKLQFKLYLYNFHFCFSQNFK